jgi:uncharacterized membrane protein
MSYFKYQAEKGSAHALWYFTKMALLLVFLLWPLVIGSHNSKPSALGWVLEVPWLIILGVAAVAYGASRRGR